MPEPAPPTFLLYGTAHWCAIALTFLLAGIAIFQTRRQPPGSGRRGELATAIGLLLTYPISMAAWYMDKAITPHNAYPLNLCNITALLGAIALIRHHRGVAALTYFWGLAGATQGLLTPAVEAGFPRVSFLIFFFLHGAIIATALYLVYGLRLRPNYRDIWIAAGALIAYLCVVYPLNRLLGTNYGFVIEKPPTGSMLDLLGPWPYYIASILGVAIVAFHVFFLPTLLLRKNSDS